MRQKLLSNIHSVLKQIIWLLLVFGALSKASAQNTEDETPQKEKTESRFKSNTKPLIWLDSVASDKKETKKKVRKKRNYFFGYKTKKAYTRKLSGAKYTFELFYIFKRDTVPNPYIRDLYWFHRQKKKIMIGPIPVKEQPYARLMHGPYKKINDGKVEEEGAFYLGSKHGRWMYEKPQADEMILQDKKVWYKGFYKESIISYYDAGKTKIKEVIPMEYGKKSGDYFTFFPSAMMETEGKYEFDRKIGLWTEYFDGKTKKVKRKYEFPKTWDTPERDSVLLVEYNEKGAVIYDKAAEDKKKAQQNKNGSKP